MGAQQSKDELLYQEVQNGNLDRVRALSQDGAGLEWVDKEGRTPLILACTRADLMDMVLLLLDLGANLESYRPGTHGGTPLHHAAKRGLDKTVAVLLSYGANPFKINDDCQTPLGMARTKGHVTVVRIIEEQISLFRGMVRELSGPGILEALAPQWLSKKIWAVVLPSGPYNPRRPPRFELAIYPTPQVSQPRTTISLWKSEIEEPKFSLPDPMLIIIDKATKTKHKFLAEREGDKLQLQRLYGACKGILQVLENNGDHPSVWGSPPLQAALPATAPANVTNPVDAELAMAIEASIQSASQERVHLSPGTQQATGTSDFNGWGSTSEGGSNGWGPPDATTAPLRMDKYGGWSAEVGSTAHNGWAPAEAGPNSNEIAEALTEESSHSVSGLSLATIVCTPSSEAPAPSAPPLPAEDTPSSNQGPIHYPTIDLSPVELNLPLSAEHGAEVSSSSSKVEGNNSGTCVICWDAPAEGACIPCGHLVGCMPCLNEIEKKKWGCPVCRATIQQVIKVYAVCVENPKP